MKPIKSQLLLGFLLISTVFNALVFGWNFSTAFLLLLTTITSLHLGLKWLDRRYQNKLTHWLKQLYRMGLLGVGLLCVVILILVGIPQFTCQDFDESEVQEMDYMIVLGAGLKDGDQISSNLKSRLDKALEILEVNPKLNVIVSGGQGPDETISEAEAMAIYLMEAGADEQQITQENKSRSTYENLLFSREKLEVLGQQPGIIVSQDFHMFRSQFIAKRMDLDTRGICSPTPLFLKTNYMIREIPAVINDALGNWLK